MHFFIRAKDKQMNLLSTQQAEGMPKEASPTFIDFYSWKSEHRSRWKKVISKSFKPIQTDSKRFKPIQRDLSDLLSDLLHFSKFEDLSDLLSDQRKTSSAICFGKICPCGSGWSRPRGFDLWDVGHRLDIGVFWVFCSDVILGGFVTSSNCS